MKIEVIGLGIVGNTTREVFQRLGYEVSGVDDEVTPYHADVHFICTPEEVVEEVIKTMVNNHIRGLTVVRSTTRPGAIKQLSRKYDIHIAHNPEFLRRATALADALRPDKIVIGDCCPDHGAMIEEMYKPLRAPVVHVDTTTSEATKLLSNAYLSCLLSFWNEAYVLLGRVGINSHTVGKILALDPRISDYGAAEHGTPYGGTCLPKDMDQLLELCKQIGYTPMLFKAIKEVNQYMKEVSRPLQAKEVRR